MLMLDQKDDAAHAAAHITTAHNDETSAPQKWVDQFTVFIGRPAFVIVLTVVLFGWIAGNLAATHLGYKAVDPAPFFWLQGTITMGTLLLASLILTTQRREDELKSHRSQLILELVISNDQKSSKIIELLEEARRDNPSIANRIDDQAEAMSAPSDALNGLKANKS
jgi:uncharacterized membrane protein